MWLPPPQLRLLKRGEDARRGQKGLGGYFRRGRGSPSPGEWGLFAGPRAAQVEVRQEEQGAPVLEICEKQKQRMLFN